MQTESVVFVGSSSEAKKNAELVASLLSDGDTHVDCVARVDSRFASGMTEKKGKGNGKNKSKSKSRFLGCASLRSE